MSVLLSDLPETLREAMDLVEVLDETGCVVGWYQPTPKGVPFGVPPPGCEPKISLEEIERRRQTYKSGRTLAEIMKDLQGRTA